MGPHQGYVGGEVRKGRGWGGRADATALRGALVERADDRAQGVPGGEPSGGDGRADAAVCGAAAAGARKPAERTGGDSGQDARRIWGGRGGWWCGAGRRGVVVVVLGAPPPGERVSRLSGRAAIQAKMRGEFERAGVWDLLRKRIAASEYTRPGDPLKIDVGYRPNGVIRMFHAVSLEPGVEMAKVLAFSAAGLRIGVERVERAQLELTAVIEPAARLGASDEEPERLEMYRFGVETMEENQIRVLTTADLGRVAETARRELRV